MKCACVILFASFLLLLFIFIHADSEVFGEMGKITYKNPKYFKDFVLVSKRYNRTSRYITSMNVTTLSSWGNNVTLKILVVDRATKSTIVAMELKICDALKMKMPFMTGSIASNSDLPLDTCPVPPGTYHYKDFAFRLKKLPFALNSGDFNVIAMAFVTDTKEKISEIVFRLRLQL